MPLHAENLQPAPIFTEDDDGGGILGFCANSSLIKIQQSRRNIFHVSFLPSSCPASLQMVANGKLPVFATGSGKALFVFAHRPDQSLMCTFTPGARGARGARGVRVHKRHSSIFTP
ncbi:Hypothetical protein CAP_6946 [Chondromyces apiculatus DSM 436]|uniref:Uncharacterized protein n=1 Tax=Chondromyces apiculatus DSM 436 TaxID=1192034 RepID=A0A017TFA0_9BACT|nr:Hypothetical protein CAP_6946 [Chondromyces apiculatus DSM 436]